MRIWEKQTFFLRIFAFFFTKKRLLAAVSPDIIKMVKSRKMRTVEYVARVKKERNLHRDFFGKYERQRLVGEGLMGS